MKSFFCNHKKRLFEHRLVKTSKASDFARRLQRTGKCLCYFHSIVA